MLSEGSVNYSMWPDLLLPITYCGGLSWPGALLLTSVFSSGTESSQQSAVFHSNYHLSLPTPTLATPTPRDPTFVPEWTYLPGG